MAKQPFRSIGLRVRDFARTHIRSYVPSGEIVSRSELPPSWKADSAEPLVWQEDAAPMALAQSVPDVQETRQERAYVEAQPEPQRGVTHNMLERLLAAHEERMARDGTAPPPIKSPDEPPAPVQRQIEPLSNNDTGIADAQPPRMVTRRRRGAVIDVPSQDPSPADSGDESTPSDFFFLNEAAPESAVQRAPASLPAPQTQPEPPQTSSPVTSFWRRMFSRGEDRESSPVTQTAGSDSPSAPAPTDHSGFEHIPLAQTPSSASGSTPTIHRAVEDASGQQTSQPPVQRSVSATTDDAPTILTPEDMPYAPVVSPPGEATTTPPSEESAGSTPTLQRATQSEAVQPSTMPKTPAIQRETSASQPTISHDQPAPKIQRKSRRPASGDPPAAASQPTNTDAPAEAAREPFTPAPETALQRDIDEATTSPSQAVTPEMPAPLQRRTEPPASTTNTTHTNEALTAQSPQGEISTPGIQRQTSEATAPIAAETPAPAIGTEQSSQSHAAAQSQPSTPAVQRSAEMQSSTPQTPVSHHTPTPISERTSGKAAPTVQRQSARDDEPIVPIREEPLTAIQRRVVPSGSVPEGDAPAPPSAASTPGTPAAPSVQRQTDSDDAPPAASEPTIVFKRETIQRSTAPEQPRQAPVTSADAPRSQQVNSQPPAGAAPAVHRQTSAPPEPSSSAASAPSIQRGAQQQTTSDHTAAEAHTGTPAHVEQHHEHSLASDMQTMLTPAADTSRVQRSANPTAVSHHNDADQDVPPRTGTFTADAPTRLTPAPQTAENTPSVQRTTSDTPTPETPQSPWSAFMQPSEPQQPVTPTAPSARRSARAQTNTDIQREIQHSPTRPAPQSAAPDWNDNDVPLMPQQPVDLFTALSDAGIIPSTSSDSTYAAPQPSRQSEPGAVQRSSQPSQASERRISPISSSAAAESSPSEHDAPDADLLSLIDLPPTTPVIRQSPATPTASRAVSPAPQEHSSETLAPPGVEEYGTDWGSIMRAQTDVPAQPGASDSTSEEDGAQQESVNVDKLARDVMDVLRQRLRIEQERRGRRP